MPSKEVKKKTGKEHIQLCVMTDTKNTHTHTHISNIRFRIEMTIYGKIEKPNEYSMSFDVVAAVIIIIIIMVFLYIVKARYPTFPKSHRLDLGGTMHVARTKIILQLYVLLILWYQHYV